MYSFCDKLIVLYYQMSIEKQILRSIRAMGQARVVTPKHFQDIGSPAAVRKGLNRLAKEKKILRLKHGLYYLPKIHPVLGALSPDPYAIIEALVYGTGAKWQVSGAYAANQLGISEQVPAKIEVLTDSTQRRVSIGKLVLTFRRAAPRNLLGVGTKLGLVFQSLRWFGQGKVTERETAILRKQLSNSERKKLFGLKRQTPVWMHSIIDQIASEQPQARRLKRG